MERLKSMAKREITFFEVEEPRKKKSASSKKGAASSAKKPASSTKKTASTTKKTASSGTKKASSASNGSMKTSNNKKSASAKKPAAKKIPVQENPLSRTRSSVLYVDNRKNPDPRRPKPRPKARPRKRRAMDGFSVLLMLCLAGVAALGVWRFTEYQNFRVMKAAVSAQTFYAGTTVDGVDVSGRTLAEAMEYWEKSIEPQYRDAAVVLEDGRGVTAAQLGYTSDYADVLSNAWNVGRSGSLEERYAHLTGRMDAGVSYTVSRSMYTDDLVRQCAEALAKQVDTQPTAASIESFDAKNYTFRFTEGTPGRKLNQQQFMQDVKAVLNNGGGTVGLHYETIAPSQTKADIESQYGLICYAITNASSSSSNRLANIKLSLQIINGTCLKPGETFSFNQVVGQRTKARGFKEAPAYFQGEVTEQVGGGICQVSTTLFNAAVKADLKIKERHAHSMTVSYVDLGKDAAVDWGNKDLKFTNTSDDNIYICCYLTDDKRVRFGIFGKLLPNGESITLEGQQTGTVDYNTEMQVSFTMNSGEKKVIQAGKKGFTATSYKIRWDANGKQISREELCKSRYNPTTEIIEYGP